MKNLIIIILCLLSWVNKSNAQNIYGFSENLFCSINVSDNSKDTLIVFSGNPTIGLGFPSAIDRFNGRYFYGGNLPGYPGSFHIIDLVDLSIESYSVSTGFIEYDFIKNRLVYERNGDFYSLDLLTLEELDFGGVGNSSIIFGQNRAYVPQTNEYFYVNYINGSSGEPYFLMVDADSGEINCQIEVEEFNGINYTVGGVVTNNLNGDIIGRRNGRFGIVSPCGGTTTKLSVIPDYDSQLNSQMAVYNHNDDTYIFPYRSTDLNDPNKIAIVDVYNDEILETKSQPWEGKMNLHQIYDQPIAPLIYLKDTLFVPQGENYKWFLNDELIGETNVNYWRPTENGVYKAEVQFREYTTFSTEKEILLTDTDELSGSNHLNIYPNPTFEYITIDLIHNKWAKIGIVNLVGKTIQNYSIENQSSIKIDLSELPRGSYLVRVDTEINSVVNLIMKN